MTKHEQSAASGRGRILYLDLLRIVAAAAVVVIHCCAVEFYTAGVRTIGWASIAAWDSFVRWAVPVFVMISGYFFLDSGRSLDIKKLYKRNLGRLLVAYIAWSAIYTIEERLANPGSSWGHLLRTFIVGKYHLWYLWMLAGLYVITPLLRKITADEKTTKYFLIIGTIVAILTPTVRTIIWSLMEIYPSSSLLIGANNVISAVLDNINLSIACYVVYFVGGYYIGHHDLSRRQRVLIYILAVLAALATFAKTIAVSWTLGRAYEAFFSNSDLCVALEALGVFTWFKYREPRLNAKATKRVGQLSSNTFGVYLVHVLVLDTIVYFFRPQLLALPAAIYIPILSAVVFAISLAITIIIRRVPHLKRIVS